MSKTVEVHTTVTDQFVPEENRDILLRNTDNEFNRAIDEEDIDFNIPGVHSAVKRSHDVNVQNLIQKIENIDMHFKVIFNNVNNSIPSA